MSELGVGFGELCVLGVEFVEVFFEFGDAGDEFGSVDLLDLGAEGSLLSVLAGTGGTDGG
jgi:hypothetical protein